MIAMQQTRRRVLAASPALVAVIALAFSAAACGSGSATTRGSDPSPTSTSTTIAGASTPLSVPKTTTVQDSSYLEDVTKADSALAVYVQQQGELALKTMLTDGSAFCAFLQRDHSVDGAISALALGAQSVESKTHLPLAVRTYNTLEAVALLTLCPNEQNVMPAADQAKIRTLGTALNS